MKTIRIFRLAGVVLALALVSAVPAGAVVSANHQVFSDRVGDVSGAPRAPDVVSLDVTSADNGDVDVKLTLNEQAATFYIGDDIQIWIDRDQDASTGTAGFDTGLFAEGVRDTPTTGHMKYTLCTFQSQTDFRCQDYTPEEIKREKIGADTHTLTFGLSTAWHTVSVVVYAGYPNPADPTKAIYDRAPDSGAYQFDARADADNDGVAGFADECPRFNGGKFDRDAQGDFDGCPPTYPVPNYTFRASRSGNGLAFTRIAVPNAPPGARVTARLGGLTVRRTGPGALPRVAGRRFGAGTTFTFLYTNPNYFGRYKVARVTASGLAVVRSGCTPPGKTTFIDCAKVKG